MGIYVKTSSGASCVDHSYNLVKTAMYCASDNYNIAHATTTSQGTAWDHTIWDDIGLTYVPDSSTYQNYFIVPFSGILILQCYMAFLDTGPAGLTLLAANLYRNDITQYTLYERVSKYLGASYTWLQKVSKGDKLKILLAQTATSYITTTGTSCRLNFIAIY